MGFRRPPWRSRRRRVRRNAVSADHAAGFTAVIGTATPAAMVAMPIVMGLAYGPSTEVRLMATVTPPAPGAAALAFEEHAREMTLVGKAAYLRDLGERQCRLVQQRLGALHAALRQPAMRR